MTLPNNKHPHLHPPLRSRSRIPIPGNAVQNLLNQIRRHDLGLSGQAVGLAKQLRDGGAHPGLLLLDPPVGGPDLPLQRDLLPGGVDEAEAGGAGVEALQGGGGVGEAVAELVEARVQQAELGQVLDGGHVAERGAQVGGQLVDDGHGAQQRVEDGAEVVGHEGAGAGAGRVDEEEGAVVRGELDEPVDQQAPAGGGEELGELVAVGRRDVALDDGDVDGEGRDDGARGGGEESRVALVVGHGHGAVEDFCGEVVVAADGGAGRAGG